MGGGGWGCQKLAPHKFWLAKKGLIASIKTSDSWYCHHEYTVLATSENLYGSKAAIVLNMALFYTASIHWQLNDKSSEFTFVGGT